MKQNRVFGQPVLDMPTTDRRNFLRVAGLVGVGTTLVAGGLGSGVAFAADAKSVTDLDILQYALKLEYLESTFYDMGVKKVKFSSSRETEIVKAVRNHEDAHVKAITATIKQLGGTPYKESDLGIKLPDSVFASSDAFLKTAATFEEVGVTAYQGQVTNIKSGDILAAAASIAGVEARHSAIFYSLTGKTPFPAPIDDHATMATVIKEVSPYINPK